MRSYLVGILLLLVGLTAAPAFGQATGYVTSLGFDNNYRPECWTPLRVHLDSTISTADDYQIQVHQQDLDRDVVVYARTVTLGPQARQDYWAYFIPEPVGPREKGGSLPSTPIDLAQVLKVYLYDKTGRTQIAHLPVNFSANNVDPYVSPGMYADRRGRKFVLCVVERAKPAVGEYAGAWGMTEDVSFISVTTRDLPESVLGYDGVDAIMWFDANAQDVSAFGAKPLEAIQQFVRRGGQLVVCQQADQFNKTAPFADMLPIVAKDDQGEWAIKIDGKPDLSPLTDLLRHRKGLMGPIEEGVPHPLRRDWTLLQKSRKSWEIARARPRPDAFVDEWIQWDAEYPGADQTPYIARRAYGLGSVVWVAQDLGSPTLTSSTPPPGSGKKPGEAMNLLGWPHLWDRVFGWNNETLTAPEQGYLKDQKFDQSTGKSDLTRFATEYPAGSPSDVGAALLRGMEHGGRGVALITLAIFFFIGYWVLAGPGSYLFLAARRRRGWSWLAFGVVALGATAATVGVVKVVLRGSPAVRHLSVVRLVPTDPAADGSPRFAASVRSRIGLYIPRDGEQRVAVTGTTPGLVSTLTPFPAHPQFMPEDRTGFPDQARYVINTDLFASGQPVTVDFPYRSTLKKLQAEWTGTVNQGIEGAAALIKPAPRDDSNDPTKVPTGTIRGSLVNRTGRPLRNVYLVFRHEGADPALQDRILYIPSWGKDTPLDLGAVYNDPKTQSFDPTRTTSPLEPAASRKPLRGYLTQYWPQFWYKGLDRSLVSSEIRFDDSEQEFVRSFPLMALFDRVGPDKVEQSAGRDRRVEVFRRNARDLDVAQLVAAGRLVILAEAGAGDNPLPLPLEVDGDPIAGEGTVLYEIALPLDRKALAPPPITRPATRPATAPATAPAAGGNID